MVAAAGNEGISESQYPAAYEGVVSVSAVDAFSRLAPYSNYGSTIDVAAPGGSVSNGILSTVGIVSGNGSSFYYGCDAWNGTSMATPHVTGVIALMKSVYPDLTPDQFDQLLQQGDIVTDQGSPGRDNQFGYGLINARKAVLAARQLSENPEPTDTLQVMPRELNFDESQTTAILTLSASGSGSITLTDIFVSTDAHWLRVTPSDVDSHNLGTYRVTVDRSGLASGTVYAQIFCTTTTSAGLRTVLIPVSLQLNPSVENQKSSGYYYVILQDENSWDNIQIQSGPLINGQYHYAFERVKGNTPYTIYAGTDFDNDGLIGNSGEFFGIYQEESSHQNEIIINENQFNLNFTINYVK